MTVKWQRLIDDTGRTCSRCATTQGEVRLAVDTLRATLEPLNINVVLREIPMTPDIVARDTAQSNRIFIDDRPLADWIGGEVGMSPCGSCCAGLGQAVKCRTLTVGGQTYEGIPAALIVRAGLLAAEASLARQPAHVSCCPRTGCPDPCKVRPGRSAARW